MIEQPDITLLRTFLAEGSVTCPACRYALRNCESDRCPECGTSLALAVVSLTHKAVLWWALAVAGTALAAGIALLMTLPVFAGVSDLVQGPEQLQLVAAGFASASDLPRTKTVVSVTMLALVALSLAVLALAGRSRFAALPGRLQIILAGSAIAWPLALLGIYALLIRHVL